ncbi:MAG: hypothetical protein HUU49_02940 [Candidatus Buchananbacteria bacterium]|nr:hypothetical protein [Candidatus Buchananbacteria bacterium]
MIVPEGLMHKKVNILVALLIILIVAISAAFAISAQAIPGIGLRVIAPPIKCTPDPYGATCLASCPICGDIAGCSSLFETKAMYLGGSNVLYKGQALCTNQPMPNRGGTFRPGVTCLGSLIGMGPHLFVQFGCGR